MDYDLSFKYHIKQVTNTLFIIFAHLDYLIAMFLYLGLNKYKIQQSKY